MVFFTLLRGHSCFGYWLLRKVVNYYWELESDQDVVLLIESSVFVFLGDGNVVGLVLGGSESVDPGSGGLLLGVYLLFLSLVED